MAYGDLPPKSSDPKIYSEQICRIITDRRNISHEDSIDLRRRLPKWYELYRGFRRSRAQPFRNQVHIPLTLATIESDVAVKASLLFAQNPVVNFMPTGSEDGPSARRTTNLVDQQFQDASIYTKGLDLLRTADVTGTGVIQWFWRTENNTRPQRMPLGIDPLSGKTLTNVVVGTFTDFNGPDFEVIDLLDFYPEPGKPRLRDMRWCIRRYWLDYDDIKLKGLPGPNGEPSLFDPVAVADLQFVGLSDEASSQLEERRINPGGLFSANYFPERFDRYSKPVEILEMHGSIPSEFVPEDGLPNRLITIANQRVVLRNVGNPIWKNGLPFAAYCPIPDPYSFYGIGKVEPNEKLQATASRFASQKLDAMDYLVDPQFFYNRHANLDTRKLYSRPGAAHAVDGPPQEAVMPWAPDMRGVQQAMVEIEQLWRWMQISSGVLEDTIIGVTQAGSDRQTAREFLGRAESSQRRLVFETLMCVDQFLVPLAEAFRALDAQFMDFPAQVRMLGTEALIDPETGGPIQDSPLVQLEDVIRRYDMKAQATTALIGKSARQQMDMAVLQAVAPTPIAMIMNWYGMARHLFRNADMSPDELLVNPQQAALRMMAMMQVQQAGQQQSAAGGNGAQEAPKQPQTPGMGGLDQMLMNQFKMPEGATGLGGPSGRPAGRGGAPASGSMQ